MIIQRRNVIIGQSQHTAQDGRVVYVSVTSVTRSAHAEQRVYRSVDAETILSLPLSFSLSLIPLSLSHSRPMFHCILLHLHGYTYTRYPPCVWLTIVKECCSASHGNLAGDNEPPRLVPRLKRVALTRFFATFWEKLAILELYGKLYFDRKGGGTNYTYKFSNLEEVPYILVHFHRWPLQQLFSTLESPLVFLPFSLSLSSFSPGSMSERLSKELAGR